MRNITLRELAQKQKRVPNSGHFIGNDAARSFQSSRQPPRGFTSPEARACGLKGISKCQRPALAAITRAASWHRGSAIAKGKERRGSVGRSQSDRRDPEILRSGRYVVKPCGIWGPAPAQTHWRAETAILNSLAASPRSVAFGCGRYTLALYRKRHGAARPVVGKTLGAGALSITPFEGMPAEG